LVAHYIDSFFYLAINKMSTGPTGPAFQFPALLQVYVTDIKKLVVLYEATTDPSLKASYKAVIADRAADLQSRATGYSSALVYAIAALVPS